MVSITTTLGEFTGDDIGQALALARKAEKAHKAQQEARNKLHRIAVERAKITAYYLLVSAIKGETMPRYEHDRLMGDNYPVQFLGTETNAYSVRCADGTGELRLGQGETIESYLWNSQGDCVAIFVHGWYSNGLTCHAVGCRDGVVATVELPSITQAQFR